MGNGYLGLDTERESLTFGGFIADCARRHGDREALVSGDRRITYRELEGEVRQFAKALLAAGVTKGATVALMLGNRPEFVIAAYGAGSIGAVVVPVSTFATAEERDHILRHSDASVLVTQPSLLTHRFVDELLEGHPELAGGQPGQLRSPAFPHLRRIVSREHNPPDGVDAWGLLLSGADDVTDQILDAAMAEVHPRDPGIIIYTSGTSAHPKAVLHANGTPIIQGWRWADALGLTTDDIVLSRFPYFWSGGFAMTLGGPLAAGATVLTAETFTPDVVLELVERERVTVLQAMPHTYSELVDHDDFARRDLSTLSMAVGAEPLVAALPDRPWRAQANGYGLTETFTFCTWADPDEVRVRYAGEFRTVHGRPLPGIDLRIVDSETGEPLPDDLFDRMVRARRFMGGWQMMRQLSFGTVDLELHGPWARALNGAGPDALMERVEERFTDFSPTPEFARYHILTSFTHLFSGGYAAGYYSYLWSEVLEADAFSRFRDEGIFNRETGRAYVESILSRGDSDDPEALFREFLGRDPDPQALLDRNLGPLPS